MDVETVIALQKFQGFSVQDIVTVVENNEKRRFGLRVNEATGKLQIRANQGHSLPVEETGLLTELTKLADFPERVIHGTYMKNWENIKALGLGRMKRNHIHFAAGLPGDKGVISGVRTNCDLFVVLDVQKALAGGIRFYKSENNVILSPGDESGFISPAYIKDVLQNDGRHSNVMRLVTIKM